MITCRLWQGNSEKSSLAEFGCDARSFAGDREGCSVGGTWRGRAVSGDRSGGTRDSQLFWGYIITGKLSEIHLDITSTSTTTTQTGARDPHSAQYGLKKIVVETLNYVGHH